MRPQPCPTDRLALLMSDQLSADESHPVVAHLEECPSCQRELETLAADATWWERATRGLGGVAVDGCGQLTAPCKPVCSVEALLELHPHRESPVSATAADRAMLDAPIHPEMLGRVDEFDVEEKIGQGGMGIVFRGFDRSLNRPVAIKVMAPHLGANGAARKRFAREAQAAAAVVHPHVVPIYRVNSSPERPYIAMGLVDGRSLQDHVARHGPLDTKDIVRISIQVADGLSAAHRQGLVHRDMKPANILLEKDVSRVMITDFGLARAVDEVSMTQSGCLAGTPNYMSPEQVAGAEIDCRSDLFSLGCVIYFMATGREPFRADSAFAVINKITSELPTPARNVNPGVPETLDRVIGRLLEKDPCRRIPSARELQLLLTEYLAHLQDPKSHALPRVRAPSSAFNRAAWRLVVVAVATACLVWGFLTWRGGPAVAPTSHDAGKSAVAGDHEWYEHEQHRHAEDQQHDEHERENGKQNHENEK